MQCGATLDQRAQGEEARRGSFLGWVHEVHVARMDLHVHLPAASAGSVHTFNSRPAPHAPHPHPGCKQDEAEWLIKRQQIQEQQLVTPSLRDALRAAGDKLEAVHGLVVCFVRLRWAVNRQEDTAPLRAELLRLGALFVERDAATKLLKAEKISDAPMRALTHAVGTACKGLRGVILKS